MTQQSSPFTDVKYGWDYGESGWNSGMDENLLKFGFLFDGNIDGIVSSLPAAANGQSYFLTTDNRVYFSVKNIWYSSPVPKWKILTLRSTGVTYQFNGSVFSAVPTPDSLGVRVSSLESTTASLGTAAFKAESYFAKPSDLSTVSSQNQAYTDSKFNPLQSQVDTLSTNVSANTTNISNLTSTTAQLTASVSGYSSGSSSSGVITLNSGVVSTFDILLTENITSFNITGAVAGKKTKLDIIFTQDAVGRSVIFPDSFKLPNGTTSLISTTPLSISLCSFVSVDGGTTWLTKNVGVYGGTAPASGWPTIADENSTFNDEGIATTGWTPTNATLSVASSYLRQTKTAAGSNSSMVKSITTFTPSNSDFILYGKARASNSTGDSSVIWLLNGSKEISIWFGTSDAGGSNFSVGSMSIAGTTGTSTKNVASLV